MRDAWTVRSLDFAEGLDHGLGELLGATMPFFASLRTYNSSSKWSRKNRLNEWTSTMSNGAGLARPRQRLLIAS